MANRWGNNADSDRLYFGGGPPKSLQMVTAAMKLKIACPWEEKSCDKPRHNIKMKKHGFAKEGPYSQSYGFFSSHVRM